MHLITADHAAHRILDEETVCTAIASISDPATVPTWTQRFSVLADPTRLRLLLCIRAAGPISVSDLAAATKTNDTTVSQALRLLRSEHAVTATRDGRVIRYTLNDPAINQILDLVVAGWTAPAGHGQHRTGSGH